jgi:hypothetical protein
VVCGSVKRRFRGGGGEIEAAAISSIGHGRPRLVRTAAAPRAAD